MCSLTRKLRHVDRTKDEPVDARPGDENVDAGRALDERGAARGLGKKMLGPHPELLPGGGAQQDLERSVVGRGRGKVEQRGGIWRRTRHI